MEEFNNLHLEDGEVEKDAFLRIQFHQFRRQMIQSTRNT